ncbi:MAG TPA: LCP family protein [Acidimicrobiales bacterium]|nr:LCP family protein [Acidimicrobiales bacterium]
MRESGTDTAMPAGPEDPFDFQAIPLPERTRGGTRAQKRRARRRRRRQRMAAVAAVVVVVLGAVAFLIGQGGDTSGGTKKGGAAGGSGTAVAPVLVAMRDPEGNATSLFVLAPGRSPGGSAVLIPSGTLTEVVSLGLEPVSKALQVGGATRLQATIENLLGVGMAGTVVLDDQTLATMLGPVGPLSVNVPERVEQVDASGRVQVLYEAGPRLIQPKEAGAYLAAKGRGTELARMARVQGFLDAWMAAVRKRPDAAPTQPVALAKAFDALAGGDVRTRVLPVESVGTGSDEDELYKVQADELARLVASAFPTATAAAGRPRVQLLNGTGTIGLAEAVQRKLGPGFVVTVSGNADSFNHAETQVVYYDRAKQAMAQRVQQALGVGTLVLSRNPNDVVDVTVVVGKDFNAG